MRLSGGQRRRVALARAPSRNASVLLLDEPTSGLDAASEQAVVDALDRAAAGRTVLAVSHRLSLAARADRVVVLDGGGGHSASSMSRSRTRTPTRTRTRTRG